MAQGNVHADHRLPSHHCSEDQLVEYAAGACSEAEALIIASHLTLCPLCREVLDRLEDIGGALLESIEPATLDAGCLAATMARLDDEAATPAVRVQRPSRPSAQGRRVFPAPLRRYLGCDADKIAWHPVMRGLDEYALPLGGGDERVKLLRIRGGTTMPRHTHTGREMTLVLAGGFTDETGSYACGDIAVSDSSVDHRPVADPGEDCICLIFTDARLKLTGPVGRWLNPFVRF